MLFLAEISDKMLSFSALITWNVILISLAWVLTRKSRWLLFIPLPPAVLFALGTLDELRDPYMGPAVVCELGYGYVVLGLLPLAAIIFFGAMKPKIA